MNASCSIPRVIFVTFLAESDACHMSSSECLVAFCSMESLQFDADKCNSVLRFTGRKSDYRSAFEECMSDSELRSCCVLLFALNVTFLRES